MEADEEDLDKESRGDDYYAVLEKKELVGFFSFHKLEHEIIDSGLGMHPHFTGKGNGACFVKAGLAFAEKLYSPSKITLSVATFNERAIKVYDYIGFKPIRTYFQETNGGNYEFLIMEKKKELL